MKYRLIVSDVDGCLSPEESIAWDVDALAELIHIIRSNELPFTLCTGRPQPYVEVLLKLLDVRIPAICENGALLYSLADNRTIHGPGVTSRGIDLVDDVRRFVRDDLLPRHPEAVLQAGKEAQVSVFTPDPDLMPELETAVRGFVDSHAPGAFIVGASHYYLNVSLTGVDKGTALAELIRLQGGGLSGDAVAVIGDTSGDLPMREHAGFFAAPANATSDVRDAADYVSPHTDIRATIDILRRITA
jgi:HAD superfamily hydrolase (TIGR01484 family)